MDFDKEDIHQINAMYKCDVKESTFLICIKNTTLVFIITLNTNITIFRLKVNYLKNIFIFIF